eukprot:COSAG02_NODE_75_length_41389_cov_106.665762_18_plen_97_part_00
MEAATERLRYGNRDLTSLRQRQRGKSSSVYLQLLRCCLHLVVCPDSHCAVSSVDLTSKLSLQRSRRGEKLARQWISKQTANPLAILRQVYQGSWLL